MKRFLKSNHRARLALGPFGSGKSSACIMEFLIRASQQAPDPDGIRRTRFVAIRNTYPELRDTTRRTFEFWIKEGVPPRGFGRWYEQEFLFHMKFNDIDCEILFRSLDKPSDVSKLLSLELTGAYINEWREISKEIYEGVTGRIGRYPAKVNGKGGATWSGIWGDSNPWHSTHWVPLLLKKFPGTIEIYRQPGGMDPDAENIANLPTDYYKNMMVGKDKAWINVYVHGRDAVAVLGSIYGEHLAARHLEPHAFEHDNEEIFTSWDFGIADSMAIWFWKFNSQRGVDILDWYENSGYGLAHYFDYIATKPYKIMHHFLPHDARARSWLSGRSAVEMFESQYGANAVILAPELSVDDGIGATRWMLEQPTTRIHTRCDDVPEEADLSGLGTLSEYKYAWDETNKCFSKNPLHNFASHSADSLRVMACAVRHGDLISRPKKPKKEEVDDVIRDLKLQPYTFDEMKRLTIEHNRRVARQRKRV